MVHTLVLVHLGDRAEWLLLCLLNDDLGLDSRCIRQQCE